MLISDDTEVTSPTDRATLLAKKFKSNFNTAVPLLNAEDMMAADPANCPADLLCSEDHVLDIILSLDTNKVSGSDGISAIMLKETAYIISPILSTLFNKSILQVLYLAVEKFL